MPSEIDELVQKCHANAKKHGFWGDEPNLAEKVALIHSEASELLEELRTGEKRESSKIIGLTAIEEEMADIVIRVFDLAGHLNVDLHTAIWRKHQHNLQRPHKHGKEF